MKAFLEGSCGPGRPKMRCCRELGVRSPGPEVIPIALVASVPTNALVGTCGAGSQTPVSKPEV
jgi:hypothetical protein